ncbi:hypothetical protein SETIT_2G347400v2 [Setaria italica]|uniref:Uncharacterized protein n=1 Tax=Setaria italica TaxID=4555 RepID=A0A368Q601_SETIT|nr:hypothetical protein SETIT_2G347400v2 [Setaria italica]
MEHCPESAKYLNPLGWRVQAEAGGQPRRDQHLLCCSEKPRTLYLYKSMFLDVRALKLTWLRTPVYQLAIHHHAIAIHVIKT